jgi:release factor glutamine methyltransferase
VTTYHLLRQDILHELRDLLDPVEAQQEVRHWLQDGLGLDGTWMAQHGGDPVPLALEHKVDAWLKRRRSGEPWPMILGWAPFFGRRFKVGRGVLVPQLESETAVRVALEVGRELGVRRCADVGAGAGNIGLTLALETDWELTLTEIDPVALRLAKANGRALAAQARYVLGDLLAPVPDPLELVVANMPFVDELRAPALEAELAFEPAVAMLAPDGGIGLSTALLEHARHRRSWACIVEIGAGQGDRLRQRALDQGWPQVSILQDARGHDRVIVARSR